MVTYLESQAKNLIGELYSNNRLSTDQYNLIFDALDEIPLLRDRDEELEKLWAELEDVPMNPETEELEGHFLNWGPGVDRDEIWQWFDKRHSKGIAYLLYGNAVDRTGDMIYLAYTTQLCKGCESADCVFCHSGECRYALVHGEKPKVTEDQGCLEYAPKF